MLVRGFLLKWCNCTSFPSYGAWCTLVSMVRLPRENLVIRLCECAWFTFGWGAAAAASQSYPVREGCFIGMDILLSGASVERDFWLACALVFLEMQPRRFWVHVGCSLLPIVVLLIVHQSRLSDDPPFCPQSPSQKPGLPPQTAAPQTPFKTRIPSLQIAASNLF